MATETPSIPRLRKLLLKFYQENDPVVLQKGFDISGLVTFTHEKGIDVVNRMLFKKYGKAIDVNAELGTAKQEFNRMSQALTTSTKIQAKEHEYRTKLYNYFKQHNPALTQPGNSKQLETLVQFALLNGLQKLSNKLYSKYRAHIEGISDGNEDKRDSIEMDLNKGVEMEGGNKFELDVERLKSDLEAFYTEMEDEEQLEVLDEMADWACEIGIEEFDKKLLQLYGQSLNGFNQEIGKPLHFNKRPEETIAEPQTPPRFDRAVPPPPDTNLEPQYETVPGIERPFEEMTDEELKDELVAFYDEHDPDNLAKLEKVMNIARRMGREGLNEQLMQIYEAKLVPLPTQRLVKPAARPIPAPVPRPLPDERGPPPPKFGVGVSGNVMAEMSHAVRDQPPGRSAAEIEAEQKKRREEEAEAKRLAAMPEFMRKALMAQKRNQAGVSQVTGADGKKVTVNILIAVCKNYKADPINGVCKNCGFAIGDHFYGFKKKEHF